MPTRQSSHSDVSRRKGPPTQRCLEVPQEAIQPGRKRSGTNVIHGQQFAKRSRENLRGEEVQASKTQAQLANIEPRADSEEELEGLLREWNVEKNYKKLERRRDYVMKSIEVRLPGMSETVKDGLGTLPELGSEVLKGELEGELERLDSISVETDQERSERISDWVDSVMGGALVKTD